MKNKLIHPLWTHLPAAAALIVLVACVIAAAPFPAEAAVHFDINGQPDNYGSPWMVFGITIGFSVFFILLSVFIDELWARQEKQKSSNWLCVLDEITVGLMAGVSLGYLSMLDTGESTFNFPWSYVLIVAGSATALAVILEFLRPYREMPSQVAAGDIRALEAEVAQHLKGKLPFVYWDSQNPLYVSLLTIVLPLVMFASAALTWSSLQWAAYILIATGAILFLPYGGQRTLVTRRDIAVRWGLPGFKVLRLDMADIATAELHRFSPLKDFGGYGIRFNREMKGYYLQGDRGVKITMNDGKKYLIGSDTPENLLAVIDAVKEAGTAGV